MLFRSLFALAAGAAAVAALGQLPPDIGYLLNQVATLMKDTPYDSQVSQAAQLLLSNYKQPGQEAQDEKIVSSLLAALSSQNVPSQATSIAESIASVLENGRWPAKLGELVSFVVNELRRPSVNTQIDKIVKQLIGFIILARTQAPEIFEDLPAGPTPTHTSTGTSTNPSSPTGTRTDTATSGPASKSESSPSSSAKSKDSQSSSEESESEESSEDESLSSESSKSNAAHSMSPLFGCLSMGLAAGAVASFF
ncbi:hypothetical protein IWW39_003643 [Coemansia spiralis]|uniref:Uncharacterized protein n=1 Tax=Coemansia spiralis TaxID=417178 RepID=A0A9W8GEI0_9FUNG|nr:hypothetical protein IWW39_003643 [Coemansia spiralis]